MEEKPKATGSEVTASTSKSAQGKRKRKLMADKESKTEGDKNNKSKAKRKVVANPAAASEQLEVQPNAAPPLDSKTKIMHNELVLSTIAKKLPCSSLVSLRKTCTTWNRNFSAQHSTQHKLIELQTKETEDRRWVGYIANLRPGLSISDFTSSLQASTSMMAEVPIKGYRIYDRYWVGQLELNDFFRIFGNTITRLDLTVGEADRFGGVSMKSIRRIVFELTPELRELSLSVGTPSPPSTRAKPKSGKVLQNLKLRKLILKTGDVKYPPYAHLLNDLFRGAVELQHLSLEGFSSVNLLQTISGNREYFPALTRLQFLKVLYLKARHLLLLIHGENGNPLHLQELEISTYCGHHDGVEDIDTEMVSLIHEFLATQSTSLRKLDIKIEGWRIGNGEAKIRYAARIPKMDKLISLTLLRDVNWQFMVKCDDASFAECCPRLKQLELNFDRVGTDAHDSPGITRVGINQFLHDGVTNLKFGLQIEDYAENRGPPPIPVLAQTWPSVSKLEVRLEFGPEVMQLLSSACALWPGLISLRVELNWRNPGGRTSRVMSLDELLTGIPTDKLGNLRQRLLNMTEFGKIPTMDKLRSMQTKFKTQLGISDLAQLQEFVLDVGEAKFNITDIGGYLGLAMMPSQAVQHVALFYQKPRTPGGKPSKAAKLKWNHISEECRNFMRSVFGPYAAIDL